MVKQLILSPELELNKHFEKEHNITITEYYERFKGKLRMPRLERPASFHANDNEDLKDQKTHEDTTSNTNLLTKRTRRSATLDDNISNARPVKKLKDVSFR